MLVCRCTDRFQGLLINGPLSIMDTLPVRLRETEKEDSGVVCCERCANCGESAAYFTTFVIGCEGQGGKMRGVRTCFSTTRLGDADENALDVF